MAQRWTRQLLGAFSSERLLGHSARISCPASFWSPGQSEAEGVRRWGTNAELRLLLLTNHTHMQKQLHSQPSVTSAGRINASSKVTSLGCVLIKETNLMGLRIVTLFHFIVKSEACTQKQSPSPGPTGGDLRSQLPVM